MKEKTIGPREKFFKKNSNYRDLIIILDGKAEIFLENKNFLNKKSKIIKILNVLNKILININLWLYIYILIK